MNIHEKYLLKGIGLLNKFNEERDLTALDILDFEDWNNMNQEDQRRFTIGLKQIVRVCGKDLGITFKKENLDTNKIIYKIEKLPQDNHMIKDIREAIAGFEGIPVNSFVRLRHLFSIDKWANFTNEEVSELSDKVSDIIELEIFDIRLVFNEFNGEFTGLYKMIEKEEY